jgi:putative ATP-dependent endonuclease of OLD family
VTLEATYDPDNETLSIKRYAGGNPNVGQLSRQQFEALRWRMVGATDAYARDIRPDKDGSLDAILANLDLGDEKEAFEKLELAFLNQLANSEVLDGVREQLAQQLSRAFPDEVEKSNLTFSSNSAIAQAPLAEVRLQITRDGQTKSLREHSDGTRALYALALYDLVSQAADIVGIDEPELHLHPTSQRCVARMFQVGSNQKLIATHSQDIVGAFPPDSIVSIKRSGIVVQPQRQFLDDEDRLIVEWWVKDKLEPLTARHVLLVEGRADRIVVMRVAELLGLELDRCGVSILELDGAGGVKSAIKLFGDNGFQTDLTVLIDADKASETAAAFGLQETALEEHGVFVCQRDLEDEYVRAMGESETFDALVSSKLFSTNELRNCTVSGPNGERTHDDVAALCKRQGRGYKTRSAIAVVKAMDETSAARILTLSKVVDRLKSAVR